MKLTSTMIDLEGDTASLGLFGEIGDDGVRPPHVQVTIPMSVSGSTDAIRAEAVTGAIAALEQAIAALRSEQ